MNLETSTQSDRTSVALLTKTISELSIQVAHLTAKLTTAQAKNAQVKNRDIGQPRPSTDIGRPATSPRHIQPQAKIEMCTPGLDRNAAVTGTAPPTDTRWRSPTRIQRVASPIMVTTSQLPDNKIKEGRREIRSGSTAVVPSEEGRDYIKIYLILMKIILITFNIILNLYKQWTT